MTVIGFDIGGSKVEAARVEYLGQKQGKLRAAQERSKAGFKAWPPELKKEYGQRFNAVKQALEQAWESAKSRVERPAAAAGGSGRSGDSARGDDQGRRPPLAAAPEPHQHRHHATGTGGGRLRTHDTGLPASHHRGQ